MSIETLALDSYITETLALNSAIADFVTDLTEPTMFFGGNDWYDMPVIDPNEDFSISMYLKLPTPLVHETYYSLMTFASTDGPEIPLILVHILIQGTTNFSIIFHYKDNDGGATQVDSNSNGEGYNDVDEWVKITITKQSPNIIIETVAADGTIRTNTQEIYKYETRSLTLANGTIGAGRGYQHYGGMDPLQIVPYGTYIKQLVGAGLGFGTVYKDDAATRFATIDDNVAVIVNSGSLGGDFSQSTAGARGLVTSFIAPTNKSLSALASDLAGSSDKCGIFNGTSSKIVVADNDLLSFASGGVDSTFTFMVWVHAADLATFPILSKGIGWTVQEYAFYIDSSRKIVLKIVDTDNNVSIQKVSMSNILAYQNEWVQIAGTYSGGGDGDSITMYVNGLVVSSVSTPNPSYVSMVNETATLNIGEDSNNGYADGKMRDVKIYDAELTDAEILTEYGANNRTADLVVHYKLYSDVKDSGPNGLDGVNTDVTFATINELALESSLL